MKRKIFCVIMTAVLLIGAISVAAKESSETVPFDGGGYGICRTFIANSGSYAEAESQSTSADNEVLSTRITAVYEGDGSVKTDADIKTVSVYADHPTNSDWMFESATSTHLFFGRSLTRSIYL